NNPDVLAANSRLMQSLQSSCEEPLRNESIESAHHDSKAPSRTSQLSLQFISPLWRRRIREDRDAHVIRPLQGEHARAPVEIRDVGDDLQLLSLREFV